MEQMSKHRQVLLDGEVKELPLALSDWKVGWRLLLRSVRSEVFGNTWMQLPFEVRVVERSAFGYVCLRRASDRQEYWIEQSYLDEYQIAEVLKAPDGFSNVARIQDAQERGQVSR